MAEVDTIEMKEQHEKSPGDTSVEPGLCSTTHDPGTFAKWLILLVQIHDSTVDKLDLPSTQTFHMAEQKSTILTSDLCEQWFVGQKMSHPNNSIYISMTSSLSNSPLAYDKVCRQII